MLILDAIMRGMASGLSLMIALVILSSGATGVHRLIPLAFSITLTAYLATHSGWADQIPPNTMLAMVLLTGFLPAVMVWMILDFFMDCCDRLWVWPALCLPVVPLCLLAHFEPRYQPVQMTVILGIYLALLAQALATWRQDLVQRRRQFRVVLMSSIALISVIFVGIEILYPQIHPAWVYAAQGATVALLVAIFGMWVLTADTVIFNTSPSQRQTAPQTTPTSHATSPATSDDASDTDWIVSKLNKAMQAGLWQREGLTITALATDLGVPEYRLRETINQRLGYRNFPAFINGYRIEAAKEILADSEQTGRSILEIAYDVGFASLGPFNRAFRDSTGQSPRAFRNDALDTTPNPPIVEKTRQIVN